MHSMGKFEDLDAYVQLLKTTYSTSNWDSVLSMAEELYKNTMRANIFLSMGMNVKFNQNSIIYYIGFSLFAKADCYQHKGMCKEFLDTTHQYMDWAWFKNPTADDQYWINHWSLMAELNLRSDEIMKGSLENIKEYCDLIKLHPHEIIPGLTYILTSANKYDFDVGHIIEEFDDKIVELDNMEGTVSSAYMFSYFEQLSLYQIKRKMLHLCLNNVLRSLSLAVKMKNRKAIDECASRYDMYKSFATPQQNNAYRRILKGAVRHEKIIDISIAGIRNL